MKAAQLLVNALKADEVEYVFGVPGEDNREFLEALRCHLGACSELIDQTLAGEEPSQEEEPVGKSR